MHAYHADERSRFGWRTKIPQNSRENRGSGTRTSYALPILLGALARQRGTWKTMGPFRAGRYGVAIAWVAVAWSVVVLAVCSLPPNQLPSAMLVGAELTLGVVYLVFVRTRFEGPKVTLATLEIQE